MATQSPWSQSDSRAKRTRSDAILLMVSAVRPPPMHAGCMGCVPRRLSIPLVITATRASAPIADVMGELHRGPVGHEPQDCVKVRRVPPRPPPIDPSRAPRRLIEYPCSPPPGRHRQHTSMLSSSGAGVNELGATLTRRRLADLSTATSYGARPPSSPLSWVRTPTASPSRRCGRQPSRWPPDSGSGHSR